MFRNRILFVRRKISTACKTFSQIPHRMHALLQAQYDPMTKSTQLRLKWILICEVIIAITMFMLVCFTTKKTSAIQKIVEMNYDITKMLEMYELWRIKFSAMIEVNEIRSSEAYRNMLKNSMNSQRILQIIEEESRDITDFEDRQCEVIKPDCPQYPPDLRGRLLVKDWLVKERKKRLREQGHYTYPRHAGMWSPPHCSSRYSVAIIIPYRNRANQLNLLLQHLPPILKRQQISYNIFVVEQVGNKTFNKGILMNAGFMTAVTRPAHGVMYHCFIFHDSDLLTEDDRNMFTCPEFPRHMSIGVDELDYVLPYQELVGGVFAIRTDHFIKLNGYSNLYWGWGGEDDDMGLRVEKAFKWRMRPPEELGRFTTIPHIKQTPFLSVRVRRQLLKTTKKRYRTDGLSSVKFTLKKVVRRHQFTHLFVDVGDPPEEYPPLINFGHGQLRRTLMQQLLERLEKWRLMNSRTPRELPKGELPGEIPNLELPTSS